jgi:bifunctional UDP-N-acetylglucosamine pyrophosphorylase/glucosamine-1-phosphate N-acetyltransferase
MSEQSLAGIIMAAGKGTRMKSDLPKTLHEVCGIPMVELVGRAFKAAGVSRPVVIIGHHGDLVRDSLGCDYAYAWQREQLGTGHAALMAEEVLKDHIGPVLIAPGDAPLLDPAYLKSLIDKQISTKATCILASCILDDPTGYGRIIRDAKGHPMNIVEEKDADPETKKLREVCVSVYCFDGPELFRLLKTLNTNNAQGEYYLTDMVSAIYKAGGTIETAPTTNTDMLMGVNDRWQLAKASGILRDRTLQKHAMAGVTIVDPSNTYIGFDVEIGVDTILQPMTSIQGKTVIGSRSVIGPSSSLIDAKVGNECTVLMSQLNKAEMRDGSRCGPFANLRPGALLLEGAKIGNFVEIKNSEIGEKTSISHLTYIGDATIGQEANIGAGTITCNYDGYVKNRTEIGARAFIGSNSTLVAPVTVGDDGFIAAGSVITNDVPSGALGVARCKQETKEEWVEKWRAKKRLQQ